MSEAAQNPAGTTPKESLRLDRVEDILGDIAAGKMVVLMDDEDRENEGDLVMAATRVRPEDINFMARFGRGLICLTLTGDRCRQLRLPLMVSEIENQVGTNFTVSIEAAEGVTTGISAHDRAQTVRAAVAPEARPEDLRQPGHIFPLMAQPGGVLNRAGHTEAGCDLARLAGLEPAAVIVEILNEDGSMARRPELQAFAREHGLRIGTIADLIRYRLEKEKSVERVAEHTIETDHGPFRAHCFEDHVHKNVHLALVKGELDPSEPTLVRVHVASTWNDVVGAHHESLGWPLRSAMRRIAEEGSGVVIVLRAHEDPRDVLETLTETMNRDPEADAPAAGRGPKNDGSESAELRTYGIGAQILVELGVRRMRVLSAPKKMHGLSGFGLEVTEYVDCD